MVSNAAEAEDLTQEAFLQLHRKIATFRGDSAFSTWLHRLVVNTCLDAVERCICDCVEREVHRSRPDQGEVSGDEEELE